MTAWWALGFQSQVGRDVIIFRDRVIKGLSSLLGHSLNISAKNYKMNALGDDGSIHALLRPRHTPI